MHSLLRRQLKRFVGDPERLPKEVVPLIEAVDAAYHQEDVDRGMLERSLDIVSQELVEGNDALRKELNERLAVESRLEQSLSMLRATLEATADGLVVVDREHHIESYNRRLLEMWGMPQELIDQPIPQLKVAFLANQVVDREGFLEAWERISDSSDEYFALVELKDGRIFERYSQPRYVSGIPVGRVWSYRDVTERRRSEHRLAEAEALRELNRTKDNLLDTISHELRTPLTSIRSYSELLLKYDDPAVRREFLEIINQECERLSRMVSDMLDLRKIELGEMEWRFTEVALDQLIADAARVYGPLFARANVNFQVDIAEALRPIVGDGDRLRQMIDNLLNNALKFTTKGLVRVSAAAAGDYALICVSDTGRGIPAADQDRVFGRFQQGGSILTDKPQGSGLGLAICREIAEHHQGSIWVESQVGVGSTFKVKLRYPN